MLKRHHEVMYCPNSRAVQALQHYKRCSIQSSSHQQTTHRPPANTVPQILLEHIYLIDIKLKPLCHDRIAGASTGGENTCKRCTMAESLVSQRSLMSSATSRPLLNTLLSVIPFIRWKRGCVPSCMQQKVCWLSLSQKVYLRFVSVKLYDQEEGPDLKATFVW